MDRQCPKCGFLNAMADGSTSEACPRCEVIYSKAEQAQARQRLPDAQRQRAGARLGERSGMDRLVWGLAGLGAVLGLLQLAYTLALATSAPQQAAGTGIAIALAVIPYCLARALGGGRS